MTVLLLSAPGFALQAAPPGRVVSLAPNLTRMVVEAGASDRLVAVTPFCEAPDGVVRLPGGLQGEPEAVFALAPDLVLVSNLTPAATRASLERLGLRVEAADTSSLSSIRATMARVAALLGVAPPATTATETSEVRGSAVLLFGADTGYTAGRGTHADDILGEAGLRNIAAEAGGPWPQLDDEVLLASDPDFIIVADYQGGSREQAMAILGGSPVRRHLSAVRDGRVLVFPAEEFSVPGPQALRTAARLRAAIHALEAGGGA
jgi:iron complex transport system substrate-binding protein